MRKIFYVSTLFLALSSCGDSAKEIVKKDTREEVAVIPTTKLTVEIDGMECVHACGGSIKKDLKSTGAVSSCKFDFESGRKTNVATIEFDGDKISEKEIVDRISKLNNKQFTVGSINLMDLSQGGKHSENMDKKGDEEVPLKMTATGIEMPNLLDLLSGFLRN